MKVSGISLGSWLTYGVSVAEEQETSLHPVKAYNLEINFFDTANVYVRGAAEEMVGRPTPRRRPTAQPSPARCGG